MKRRERLSSSVRYLADVCDRHGWRLNEGRIVSRKYIHLQRVATLKIFLILFWILWFLQLRRIPSTWVTLVGETIYLRTVAKILSIYSVPFRWIRARTYLPYYIASTEAVPVLGCLPEDLSEGWTFLPVDEEERRKIAQHTGYELPEIDQEGYYTREDVLDCSPLYQRLTQVGSVGSCFFFHTSGVNNESPVDCRWISRYHFTDVTGLQNGEEITNLVWDSEIENFYHQPMYRVLTDTLMPLSTPTTERTCLYGLSSPRPFNGTVIHPFYFPAVKDILLVIRLWTIAWIKRDLLR